ncbi:unnamed protein product [Nippostrongylus brasiliensis]|uniref:Exosome complex component CSL4 (inferred by orthology to a human protein) n=1 Tax=Nippostrongylus brasiliensis TaxID=27835 RepID=A0A158R148_NIPBR|nr:hypothetical protein Q1695_008634 [Nippostrongylus brasiliensis]VDL76664.1 unnamed protein product [Nippostrongylus brasiliensis]
MTRHIPGTAVRAAIPGDALYSTKEGYMCGRGVYELRGFIRAARVGYVFLSEESDPSNSKTAKVVEVLNRDGTFTYQVPFVGAIVTARVVEICDKYAKCTVFRIEDTSLQKGVTFSAIIRKEDMRTDVKLDQFKVRDCMVPGDYVIANVVSAGDTHYLLSTADVRLGVVAIKSPYKNVWLPPQSAEAKSLGPRKIALIPSTIPNTPTV